MKNIYKNTIFSFFVFIFCFSLGTSAFCFGEYLDDDKKSISIRQLSVESALGAQEKKLFVSSFKKNLKDTPPDQINSDFKTRNDVNAWIKGVFDEEWDCFKNGTRPVKFIEVFKEEKLIGFAIVEPWEANLPTLHIRLFAILPDEQSHGYGRALIEELKKLPEIPSDRIIVDTRKTNAKARRFYTKNGFYEVGRPHDLKLGDYYLGLEWVSPEIQS